MKISDLIQALQQFDPDLQVLVDGYEGGSTVANAPRLLGMKHAQDHSEYTGEFREARREETADFTAVLISRYPAD
jgi:hypothetical protein